MSISEKRLLAIPRHGAVERDLALKAPFAYETAERPLWVSLRSDSSIIAGLDEGTTKIADKRAAQALLQQATCSEDVEIALRLQHVGEIEQPNRLVPA